MMIQVKAKKGRVEVSEADGNVRLAIARDDGRIYSREGAGWVDLTLEQATALADALAELTGCDHWGELESRGNS
jgi:hypothetical protein